MHYRDQMRRHFIWYGLAVGWSLAALIGFMQHHTAQAVPALVFALLFALAGVWIGRRDALARSRVPRVREEL